MAGRASFAGSSSNLLSRSSPMSVHEKKQKVPTAVAGGSLHIPSSFGRDDWALAVAVSKPSRTRIIKADCCFRCLIESDDSSMEHFEPEDSLRCELQRDRSYLRITNRCRKSYSIS